MPKNCVVFGAGPHGRVIIDILREDSNLKVIGLIDSRLEIGQEFYGLKVLGRQNDLERLSEAHNFSSGIVAIGDNFLREKVVQEIVSQVPTFEFVNAISKSSLISPTAKIGVGNVLMPGTIVNSEAIITNHCIINTNSSLEHNCFMDEYSSLSAGVVTGGYAEFGRYTAIALGVTILDRTKIGANVVVGSGSLVVKDLESNHLYYGSPAKQIRNREPGEKFLK